MARRAPLLLRASLTLTLALALALTPNQESCARWAEPGYLCSAPSAEACSYDLRAKVCSSQ